MKPRLALAALVLSLAACGAPADDETGITATKEQMGDAWPLTVDKVTLGCMENGGVTVDDGSKLYALNGTAESKYAEIDPIWADNPDIPGTKKDIGPLIDRARKFCHFT